MRVVFAAVLIVVAVSATLLSWGPLRNVFADYQDSPLWVYLLFGLFWLAIACGAAAGAFLLLRRH
jgi:succinate dehydrogenase hydrophobic anchor subunit